MRNVVTTFLITSILRLSLNQPNPYPHVNAEYIADRPKSIKNRPRLPSPQLYKGGQ